MKRFSLLLTSMLFLFTSVIGQYKIILTPKTQWGHKCWTFVYVPQHLSTQKLPTILFFHGRGAAGSDSAKLVGESLPKLIKSGFVPKAINPRTGNLEKFIVIASQDPSWSPGPEEMKYTLKWLVNNHNLPIDTNRIYTTGLSAGGGRSLVYPASDSLNLNSVSAVVSMSPTPDANEYIKNFKTFVKKQVPVWFYAGSQSGDEDKRKNAIYYISEFKKAVDSLSKYGVVYMNYWLQTYNGGHSNVYWDQMYRGEVSINWNGKQVNMYEWFLTFSKDSVIQPPKPPIPDTSCKLICAGDVDKIKKIIVLLKDNSYLEFDSTYLNNLMKKFQE